MNQNKYRMTTANFRDEFDSISGKYLSNWPILYILTETLLEDNIKKQRPKAYIGETTNGLRRLSQHAKNEAKKEFDKVNFIYSKEFNQSVTFDYESKLIQYFSADGIFELRNRNGGLADIEYYDKNYYDGEFKCLWEYLRRHKIVKHTIEELENTDIFKYSPYKTLTDQQREAVEAIAKCISEGRKETILVKGMPGSGKTIVAIFLFKFIKDKMDKVVQLLEGENPNNVGADINFLPNQFKDKKMGFVVPQSSLRKTLKEIFKGIYGLKAADVMSPSEVVKKFLDGTKYDVLLVDEAHRLRKRKNITNYRSHDANNKRLNLPKDATELDWVLYCATCPVLFYDQNQVIGPAGIEKETLEDKVEKVFGNKVISFTLNQQMRSNGGTQYIEYIENILNMRQPYRIDFPNENTPDYAFCMVEDFKLFNDLMYTYEDKYGLVRMMAGYAWQWNSKNDTNAFDIEIDGIKKQWNQTLEDWIRSGSSIDEVGSIHTLQGYDLNYGFVILGPDITYDEDKKCISINRNSYFDKKGKNTATDQELTEYIKNIYYVLLSRGIKGTYIYVSDPSLREYLKKFVRVYNKNI